MKSQGQLAKFGLQLLVGLAFAALILMLTRGGALLPSLPTIPFAQVQWLSLAVIFLGIGIAAYFAEDKFSLYVASMFLLVSLLAIYTIIEVLNFTGIGTFGWALVVFISFVGAVRIYFQRQL
jgi:hypothetical protein